VFKFLPRKKIVLLLGDAVIIAVAMHVAPFLRTGVWPHPADLLSASNVVALLVYLFVLYLCDLYNIQPPVEKVRLALKFFVAVLVIGVINASLFYLFHLRPYSSWVLFISSLLTLVGFVVWRFVFIYLVPAARRPVRVLLLGAGKGGAKMAALLKGRPEYQMVGFVDDDENKQGCRLSNLPVIGKSKDLMDIVRKYAIKKIVVCISKTIRPDIFPILVEAKFKGITVYEMPTFYEMLARRIPVEQVNDIWLGYAEVSGLQRTFYNLKLKNLLDRLLAALGLLIASPVMLLTALLIKLESKGPVLYRQKRMGLDERDFDLFKFRSMRADAEVGGAVWAQTNDPRVTRIGKMIRKLRIDELPQLWNVLKGEMSFVGPRPERPEFVNLLKKDIPYYMLRHSVRPGITGWAQVNYPYGASVEDALEKLQYDLYYIKNGSFLLDMHIMLRTVRVMLFGIGAR